MDRRKFIIIGCIIAICGLLLGYFTMDTEKMPGNVVAEKEVRKVSVRLVAVGDNLIHSPIFNSCKTDDGFNFDGIYKNISGYIADADIAAINQETIFIEDELKISGYPAFGSPCHVGESTRKAGFNVVTHATNHTMDRGADSILYTMDFWKKYDDVIVLGINESEEEQNNVKVWEKDGIKIAMLNFTYGLNDYKLPEDKPYLVNVFKRSGEDAALINKAEECADITVAFIHFGTEYTHTPTTEQKQDVEFLCENGVDIIIGSHPHVVQPMAKHISENGNEAIVFYSLGNFLSNQDSESKILGAMADITITKENGTVRIESSRMHPTVTHRDSDRFSVYMLEDYTNELAEKHIRVPGLTTEKLWELYDSIMKIEVY